MKVRKVTKRVFRRFCMTAGLVALSVTAVAATHPMMAPRNGPAPHKTAIDAAFLSHGKRLELYSGAAQPVMLWQVATWCGSCKVGLQALAQHRSLIDASDLRVVVLRDYKNGGYPGEDMDKFVAQNAPALLHDSHFIIGDDTAALYRLYNPHHFVDVYYLIAPSKQILVESSNPAITFAKIKRFIKTEVKR